MLTTTRPRHKVHHHGGCGGNQVTTVTVKNRKSGEVCKLSIYSLRLLGLKEVRDFITAAYVREMTDLYTHRFNTVHDKLLDASEETKQDAASSLFIAAQCKFSLAKPPD